METLQPIEHLAALRTIPSLLVFRPADIVGTLERWDLAIRNRHRPSLLAHSRRNVPQLRREESENLSARGADVLRGSGNRRDITILATGTDVSLAVETAERLAAEGVGVAAVSMPSWDLFTEQPQACRDEVLGSAPRVAVEAAGKFGRTR